jgi:hypothetical protein
MFKPCTFYLFDYILKHQKILLRHRKERIDFRLKLYTLRENREIKPKAFMNLVSSMLYEKRLQTTFYTSFALFLLFSRFGPYFINPVIAGLDNEGKPFISTGYSNKLSLVIKIDSYLN